MSIVGTASNVKGGKHPEYTVDSFLEIYPQFKDVPMAVLTMYVDMALENLMYDRWLSQWKVGVSLYIAHYITLYLASKPLDGAADGAVGNAGKSIGLTASKSVGGVSVSYDNATSLGALTDWASYTSTTYGAQFATMARLLGRAGMVVQ